MRLIPVPGARHGKPIAWSLGARFWLATLAVALRPNLRTHQWTSTDQPMGEEVPIRISAPAHKTTKLQILAPGM